MITLYYYEELTLREIGEVLGVTESRVSQLHTKAILRLKGKLHGSLERPRPTATVRAAPLSEGRRGCGNLDRSTEPTSSWRSACPTRSPERSATWR